MTVLWADEAPSIVRDPLHWWDVFYGLHERFITEVLAGAAIAMVGYTVAVLAWAIAAWVRL